MTESQTTLETPATDDAPAAPEVAGTAVPVETAGTATPAETPVQRERRIHGPESAMQAIGHLGTPRKDAAHAVYEGPKAREGGEPTKGYIWGTIALNRGEGYDPTWLFYNIFPVENDNGDRPTPEQMQALAASLTKGRRVKFQGPVEVRPGKQYEVTNEDGSKRMLKDQSVTLKLFWDGSEVPTDTVADGKVDNPANAAGSRPITFLPKIANPTKGDGPDLGF